MLTPSTWRGPSARLTETPWHESRRQRRLAWWGLAEPVPERQEFIMADKSPRSHMTSKSKSIKEKRAEKHAKADAKSSHHEFLPPRGKR